MNGDDRVRFCSSCNLNVYNFAEMTSYEVQSLIANSGGRLCGRLYRRTDGTVLTRDCPVGLRAVRRKVKRIAGAVFATILTAGSVVFGQSSKNGTKSCTQTGVSFERTKDKGQIGEFTGFVVDMNEAHVPGAMITLVNEADKRERSTKADDNGAFTFAGVNDGTYTVKISAVGFKTFILTQVQIRADELTRAGIHLAFGEPLVMTGIVAIPVQIPEIEYTNGTMIIRGDAIRKLPIP
jgi:hypothetical protein